MYTKEILIKNRQVITLLGLFFYLVLLGPAFAATPRVGAISPSSGLTTPATAKTFTCTYTDTDGWKNLKEAYLLISASSISLSDSAWLYYNQKTNRLYLRDDTNTRWLGGYAPGSRYVIENSYVKLNCRTSKVSGSNTTLTVNFNLTFKSTYSGKSYKSFLKVTDDTGGYADWTQKGNYTVDYTPSVESIAPSSGTSWIGTTQTFTTTYADSDGWQNIQYVYLLINTSPNGRKCFYGSYNQNTNKLYLRDDANTKWLGGYAPGSRYTIENSYAKLNCASTSISGLGATLTVSWSVSFKSTFTGAKNSYLYVKDDANTYQDWTQKGTWSIYADTTPPTGTVKINKDSQYTNSTLVSLTLSAEDNPGGTGLSQMKFSSDNSNWLTPEDYTTSKSWTFTSSDGTKPLPDGTKTIYVKFSDLAGNWSEAFSDTIILDTLPPDLSLSSVLTPTNQDITLSYTVTDNFTLPEQILITGDNSPYTKEGDYNITLTAHDLAGNTTSRPISFTIDKTAPVVIINSPKNGDIFEDSQVTLSGTIDGVAFSETRTLDMGENILTKTTTDSAGNTGSSSVSVYYYLSGPVGPEGGEVISADGKIKIVIPKDALSERTGICILPVNKKTLENTATPSDTTLLCIAECRPYGLVFNKPVSIIYTLDQPEIPGTSVELGFYDSFQQRIIPAGQTSTVQTDNYTISFSIMHFSTYAALKNLTCQDTPIGSGIKLPLPALFTGSFSYSIPITVPPGRKGMQPSLGLNYCSSNSNSWLGPGFSLNPGYITRSTRLGPPAYIDTQDTFYLVTEAGTTELVYLIDNLYQARIESSFTKFFKEKDDSWKAIGKDGSILKFGQGVDSKETSDSGTFSWYLTKAVDNNGNYTAYHYTKDQGKAYLSRIDWTGNEIGISPTNTAEFFLEPRDDISSSYISTARIATAKRLKEIQVKVNYDLVWRYVLEYAYSPDTNRSLLRSIKQYGNDGTSLPEQKFGYQTAK